LTPPEPVEGDVNQVLLRALEWLDSPWRNQISASLPDAVTRSAVEPLDPQLARVGRILTHRDLQRLSVEPTAAQAEAIRRIAEIVTRCIAPACAVVCGPSGCGKTASVATAALRLLARPAVREVLHLAGAAIASGAIFPPQRDERLRQVLELAHARPRTLVVLEQFDLVVRHSDTAACLIAEYIDRGLKLVAVARSEFTPKDLEYCDVLARRAEPVLLGAPEPEEQRQIVLRRLQSHPLAKRLEVAPEVVPTVLLLARLRYGANPGAALSLLDAGLTRAAWSGTPLLCPDDFYGLVPQDPEED
jgi:ATP-dependent Clp protease ATP-binding subunit ClpA